TAVLALPTCSLFRASPHFATPHAWLEPFSTATLMLCWFGMEGGRLRRPWMLLASAAAGLALLAKGPVGVVLPLLVVGVYLVWSRHVLLLVDRVWWQMSLVCGLLALPWYVLVTVDTKREFLTDFLLTHNLDRALTPMEDHRGPPFYYLIVLAVGLLPWSVFLGSAVWYGLWSAFRSPWCRVRGIWTGARDAEGDADRVDAYRYLWCWVAV